MKIEQLNGELTAHECWKDESNPKPLVAGSRDFYLPLTYQLYTEGLLPQIPCPVKTADGRFYIRSSHLAIVFRFMEGEEVGFGVLPNDVLAELATLVGRLHRSTNYSGGFAQ